jgi:hypothetical protein
MMQEARAIPMKQDSASARCSSGLYNQNKDLGFFGRETECVPPDLLQL